MSLWQLLDEKAESDLHKTRLLNVEEKPFKRIAKRVGTASSLVSNASHHPSPPQNGARQPSSGIEQLKDDFLFDFAAFDSSITRLQFLLDANARERERYQEDQQKIMAECQGVRDSNAQLREQLEAARATLAQRKKFDDLADKITSNRMLRPREDQLANLAKLEEECRELERESETYSETWTERRNQFNRIMEEGMLLRRQIRDEKEEVDRREGMNENAEDDDEADKGGRTPRQDPSGSNTPRPEGEGHPKLDVDEGRDTPLAETVTDGATPRRESLGGGQAASAPALDEARLHPRSRLPSREASPASPAHQKGQSKEDVEMEDQGRSPSSPGQGGEELTTAGRMDQRQGSGDQMEVDDR